MLRTITENMFDAVAGLTIIAAVFYLSAITHIVPLPENALKRLGEVSLDIMDVLFVCGAWLASFLLWKLLYCSPKTRRGGSRPTWRSCRTYRGRSSPASIKIEKINGGKGDDDSGETEPKHIANIVPGHALPSFYFG
jgi:hypothetical protein